MLHKIRCHLFHIIWLFFFPILFTSGASLSLNNFHHANKTSQLIGKNILTSDDEDSISTKFHSAIDYLLESLRIKHLMPLFGRPCKITHA
ncbi:hypothetical protein V8C26DRAFT_386371 [Trichoderma gracile]